MGSGGGGGEMRRVVEDMVVLPGFIKNYKANGFSNICRHELLGFLLVHNRCWILGFLGFYKHSCSPRDISVSLLKYTCIIVSQERKKKKHVL